MTEGRQKLLTILCALWMAVVIGYMAWGTFTYSGLYRWLAEWQVEQWGGYYQKWTAALPGLVLCLPALAWLGHRSRAKRAEEAASPAAQARTARRTAWIVLAFGLVCIAVGGGAWALSRNVPDGSEPAMPFDAARLGTGPAPTTKVRIRGTLDPEGSSSVERRGGADERVTYYAGFRPDNEAKDAPLRLFIERNTPGPEALTSLQAFLPEQTGYLIENGVPELALEGLRARGVRLASPHWLLKTRDGALRDPYYITAALGGVFGLVCLIVALAGFLQARRRAWLATAIRVDQTPGREPRA